MRVLLNLELSRGKVVYPYNCLRLYLDSCRITNTFRFVKTFLGVFLLHRFERVRHTDWLVYSYRWQRFV